MQSFEPPDHGHRIIVCEGTCSPGLEAWDALVKDKGAPRWTPVCGVAHTPHEYVSFHRYRCVVCQHQREY